MSDSRGDPRGLYHAAKAYIAAQDSDADERTENDVIECYARLITAVDFYEREHDTHQEWCGDSGCRLCPGCGRLDCNCVCK